MSAVNQSIRIRAVRGALDSNTFIVEAGGAVTEAKGAVIIIDAGAPVKAVLSALKGKIPDAVLLTHEHFDHILHIADYCREFSCPVYCHSATAEELETNELNGLLSLYGDEVIPPGNFDNFVTFKEDCSFTAGQGKDTDKGGNTDNKVEIKAVIAPGHSLGSVVYLICGELFTGDVLFADSIGRTDLMDGGPEIMQKTLLKMQKIKFTAAYHGHGPSSTYEEQQKNIACHLDE